MSTAPTTDGRPSGASQPAPAGAAPPHSIEAEQSVLGAILLSDRTLYALRHRGGPEARGLLPRAPPRDLRVDARALRRRASRSTSSPSPSTCARAAELDEAGGQAEIDALTAAVPARRQPAPLRADRPRARAAAPPADRDLRDPGQRPRPRGAAARARRAGRARDPRGRPRRPPEGLPPVGEVLHAEIDKWQELSAEGRSLTGTPSGFADLDAITGGFQPGNLIIIAARPSMGKSALVTNMAENVALNKDNRRPVALFSLEMSEAELAQRFIASQASIKGDDLRKGRLRDEAKWKRVLRTAGEYDAAPLYVDDSSDIGILDVRAKARRLHQQAMAEYGGLGPDHRRLPAAHAGRLAHREPRAAGGRDEPRAEDPRARAQRAGHRAQPALAWRRVADRQAPDALRPERVRARSSRTRTS